ncbi:MAG: hypothetical protein A2855_01120 [Candidatus Liptonbacteria bacterium RIFCSPHIGHO2_01_FULL_57_28]|uniref:DUF458 domain-containing protein n=1 Tax=Candidatus Liptonbacteria bacterium RIFCSPHIGHO2_01_FULL_57_28 TaxID=1798647 RepID=A0A1G2C9T9_9BACT|nr:MAG: hypothetical protein A2855_01120 [Candidatus Liptonbacteria bacterium RIFCSPHIGHO2_01_FULL_57_28]
MDSKFHSSLGLELSIPQIVAAILGFMREAPERRYRVTLGTDSELLADKQADFVTAIVVHRIGNGGRYFWRRFNLGKFHTLRDRIIQEVMISLDAAQLLLAELRQEDIATQWDFEIHVDVGENGPTKPMIQEVVGMIRAHNFEARTKPESYAASNVADRHV